MSEHDGCVFCMIVSGELPSERLHEDGDIVAFRDIDPTAPTHILVIPREHVPTLEDLDESRAWIVGRMVEVARALARAEGIVEDGYRLVINVNRGAGQIVSHLHLHLLGGRRLGTMG